MKNPIDGKKRQYTISELKGLNFFYRAGRPCIAHNNLFEFTGNHNEQ